MPELPEVETTARGIAPHLVGSRLQGWVVRNAALRWPVELPGTLLGQRFTAVSRRAKYLLLETGHGRLIVHLGMSGSLRVLPAGTPALKHDHVDLQLDTGRILRFNDPRRFGSIHWHPRGGEEHWLLAGLGLEPLSEAFSGRYLKAAARGRRIAVKPFLMDGRVLVGVGNIYASEALFLARVRPTLQAARVTLASYLRIELAIRQVLQSAIDQGGTTLRDFVNQDGQPGYFRQSLFVYGRGGQPCKCCGTPVRLLRQGQRASFFCPKCQRAQGIGPTGC